MYDRFYFQKICRKIILCDYTVSALFFTCHWKNWQNVLLQNVSLFCLRDESIPQLLVSVRLITLTVYRFFEGGFVISPLQYDILGKFKNNLKSRYINQTFLKKIIFKKDSAYFWHWKNMFPKLTIFKVRVTNTVFDYDLRIVLKSIWFLQHFFCSIVCFVL